MTIWERITNALASLGIPMAESLYMVGQAEYPDMFLVYSLVSNVPEEYADNEEILQTHRVQISIYSRNGLVNLPDVAGAMKTAGFSRIGTRELPFDSATKMFGLALDFYFTEETL